jgi:adenine-specific DNA-methyltransferase
VVSRKPPKTQGRKTIEALRHEEARRKNIPTAEFRSVVEKDARDPVRIAYERRNRDLDPQLVWRGKDEQDWSDLVVHAPPLYIQEKVHPKALVDDLLRQTRESRHDAGEITPDLFADFNGLPTDVDKTEFYQHDQNWSNRMILGDSLQVMASLAEREGMRGRVQCIYFDPPYGIKFNSNFQWSTTSRDVKDGRADHITREPEQVKAFRDTWRDGIHSYLTYIRDRLTVARDLLKDSGSLFVQIGDENVHLVRAVLDEVFGAANSCGLISFRKTSAVSSPSAKLNVLASAYDYLLWYAKKADSIKYRQLLRRKELGEEGASQYTLIELPDGTYRRLSASERADSGLVPSGRIFGADNLVSPGYSGQLSRTLAYQGSEYSPGSNSHWKTTLPGMARLAKASRMLHLGAGVYYKRFIDDFPVFPLINSWSDTSSSFMESKVFVVQTTPKVIERCLLMTTDPGDLVLDPTCGSGTTATVAEQWGRRWITIDTSRVALALARARIMGARYPFYLLADSREGQVKEAEVTRTAPSSQPVQGNIRHGFVFERVSHITLKSIANNAEIDVIWEQWQKKLEPLREKLNAALEEAWQEWEIPRESDAQWPDAAKRLHADWWQARIARQQEIDKSIAAKAEFEFLYDKPYEDNKKVRVAGPFTVESLSPHRMLAVNENDDLVDIAAEPKAEYAARQSFPQMILENLKTAGVQQAHKSDRITFTAMMPWPGRLVCAQGRYMEGAVEKRAAIFIGPEFGTVQRADLVEAAREAGDSAFDVLISCAFNYEAHTTEFTKLGRIPVLKARMNADLHMAEDLKNTGKGNLFVVFGEPDLGLFEGGTAELDEEIAKRKARVRELAEVDAQLKATKDLIEKERIAGLVRERDRHQRFIPFASEVPKGKQFVEVRGVDVFKPQTGEVVSDGADGIACWFIDTDYNEESFFVRHAYFLGANDPYSSLKTTLKAEIDADAWATLHSDTSRPFDKPKSGRIAVKVINHLGDEVMKVFRV